VFGLRGLQLSLLVVAACASGQPRGDAREPRRTSELTQDAAPADDPRLPRVFGEAAGIVRYRWTLRAGSEPERSGTGTLQFIEWGRKQAETGMLNPDSIKLFEQSGITVYIPELRSATRIRNALPENFGPQVAAAMPNVLEREAVGSRTVAGLECDVVRTTVTIGSRSSPSEMCVWKGLTLAARGETDLPFSGKMITEMVAISVDFKASIDPALFVIPDEVVVKEIVIDADAARAALETMREVKEFLSPPDGGAPDASR
jgi:hypothetical protein